jgi:hypothetical protein
MYLLMRTHKSSDLRMRMNEWQKRRQFLSRASAAEYFLYSLFERFVSLFLLSLYKIACLIHSPFISLFFRN